MTAPVWCLICLQDMNGCRCMQRVNGAPSVCCDVEADLFTALALMPWAGLTAAYQLPSSEIIIDPLPAG